MGTRLPGWDADFGAKSDAASPAAPPYVFNIPVVSFLGFGYVRKCVRASLSVEAESGTFALPCTDGYTDAAGPKLHTGCLPTVRNYPRGVFCRSLCLLHAYA